MQVFMSDELGRVIEGLVLAVGRNRLRLVAPRWPDSIEIYYRDLLSRLSVAERRRTALETGIGGDRRPR